MKSIITWILVLALLEFTPVQAQNTVPTGFTAGTITLADQSVQTGFIKEDFRKKASLSFIPQNGGKKTTYDGNQLNGIQLDTLQFICYKGDFYRVICTGGMQLLEKWSDASAKPVYIGTEAQFINGTEGKPGDLYLYVPAKHDLVWMNKKNSSDNRTRLLAGCPAALEKVQQPDANMEQLKSAVIQFNQCHP